MNGLYGGSNYHPSSLANNPNNTIGSANVSITRSVRIVGRTFSGGGGGGGESQRETERLRQRVYGLEQENEDLRRELERIKLEASRSDVSRATDDDKTESDEKENLKQ